jgi:hypothetical protein
MYDPSDVSGRANKPITGNPVIDPNSVIAL